MIYESGYILYTIFMLLGIRPSVRLESEGTRRSISVVEKRNQPDTSAPPNRVAAATSWLKVVRRCEYNIVI